MTTTTINTTGPAAGGPSDTVFFDADGHVIEDVPQILDRLPGKYRDPRKARQEDALGRLHRISILPPLGYLSSFPMGSTSSRLKSQEEQGDTVESWLYFLDAIGIQRTVLYPTLGLTIGRVRDIEYVIEVTRAWNDWMAETYLRHPSGKFQAAALLPMQVPSAAAAELRRVVTELGFAAAVLPGNGLPNHLGSEIYFPVYEAAQELDVGLAVHGGVHDGFGHDDFNLFAPVHALGFPLCLLRALGGMMFNRVFDLFPGLRVAFLEGGAAWTLMAAERFSESFKGCPPVESDRILKLAPGQSVRDYMSELMQAGRIVVGCEGGEHQLATAVRYFGCTPFMYSSDFPHEVNIESCRHELAELAELPLAEEDKRLLLGGTAQKFYKFT